ncbi:helicase HerA domain-containing protein [Massilia genomosp. 1]|uniref:DUF87 domain-containing protein n=1 Tax=Massilia genomosp. 1 TaxID=2609280 RepID=A0ABX0MV46_9BURK|nr:DUF87 domain-containing protein [Massilia genomosp. 1]NHZ66632.1 DUF87 domain-containing protein [Massilia genomosp. 1]
MSEFKIDLGMTRTVDRPDELSVAIAKFKQSKKSPCPGAREPLTFAEFTRLMSSGSLTRPPAQNDPFIYRGDSELSKTDEDIRRATTINPEEFRRLRRAFLYAKARDLAIHKIDYEKEILTHPRNHHQGGTPTHSDYVAYLATFHKNDLEAFFQPWALPVSSHDLKAHAYIGAGSGHGKSELIKVMLYGLLKQRQGVILFDPHGDIAEEVVRWKEFSEHPERLIY